MSSPSHRLRSCQFCGEKRFPTSSDPTSPSRLHPSPCPPCAPQGAPLPLAALPAAGGLKVADGGGLRLPVAAVVGGGGGRVGVGSIGRPGPPSGGVG